MELATLSIAQLKRKSQHTQENIIYYLAYHTLINSMLITDLHTQEVLI